MITTFQKELKERFFLFSEQVICEIKEIKSIEIQSKVEN